MASDLCLTLDRARAELLAETMRRISDEDSVSTLLMG